MAYARKREIDGDGRLLPVSYSTAHRMVLRSAGDRQRYLEAIDAAEASRWIEHLNR